MSEVSTTILRILCVVDDSHIYVQKELLVRSQESIFFADGMQPDFADVATKILTFVNWLKMILFLDQKCPKPNYHITCCVCRPSRNGSNDSIKDFFFIIPFNFKGNRKKKLRVTHRRGGDRAAVYPGI